MPVLSRSSILPRTPHGNRSGSWNTPGSRLKILTGDNELVTRKICEEIGLEIKGVLSGEDIEHMDVQTLSRVVENVTVFSRMTPVQKNGS